MSTKIFFIFLLFLLLINFCFTEIFSNFKNNCDEAPKESYQTCLIMQLSRFLYSNETTNTPSSETITTYKPTNNYYYSQQKPEEKKNLKKHCNCTKKVFTQKCLTKAHLKFVQKFLEKSSNEAIYKFNTSSCKTKWTLKHFKNHSKYLRYDGPITLKGKRFQTSDLPNVAWELCVEIGSARWNDKTPNLIWLCQIGPTSINNYVNTKYKIYAIKDRNERIEIARFSNKFENQEKLGCTEIDDFEKLCHSDKNLYLHCEVEINYCNAKENIKNNNFKMLEENIFTDCVIKVDKKTINVHKSILAINSKIFFELLKQKDLAESEDCEIIISDFSSECVEAMLEYFYTGGIKKKTLENNAYELFLISHKYKIKQLIYMCENCLSDLFDSENLLKCIGLIKTYQAPILEKKFQNYIQVNKQSLLKSKEWEEIENNYPQLSNRILKSAFCEF
ncbi:hypothetical protein Mgra_00006627 [Meloidogyne graminicola]|uniref:BTB domain-containing protein n=1 Tax=Meloidogyne graminicola TaxID=189291 RepID=A0A8S9ZKW2_9BILA|nr:hypothetical protein Mgra_00006627 [Meloidogyne graminicola]